MTAPLWPPTDGDIPAIETGRWSAGDLPPGAAVVYGTWQDTSPRGSSYPATRPGDLASPPISVEVIEGFAGGVGDVLTGYDGTRPWILAGLGDPTCADVDSGFRVGLAAGVEARERKATTVACRIAPQYPDAALTGFLQGLTAALHSPARYRSESPLAAGRILVDDPDGRAEVVAAAAAIARACHHARNIQNAPANVLTPRTFAARAEQLAEQYEHVTATILDEDDLLARGMGAFASVARGSDEPARLIELRYEPPGAVGPLVGWVGKGVTFDSGGTNIKTGTGIREMKFDMSGAAAVIESVGAVAELGLPVRIIAVAGATENMPGAHATRPGDIVRAANGVTIEVTNTDAEGRLVLADCLDYARSRGADRLIDVATLTGSVVTLFGGRYGALMSNDDEWAGLVERAGRDSGDWVWRLPLDPFYAGRIEGRYADIVNSRTDNDAGTILAGEFLRRFVGDTPWAHVDALAWDLPHQPGLEGGAAYGVRLLVESARAVARES